MSPDPKSPIPNWLEAVLGSGPAGECALLQSTTPLPGPSYVDRVLASCDRVMASFEFHIADCDPYVYLGRVKLHLADKVMNAGDVQAWWLLTDLQELVLEEAIS